MTNVRDLSRYLDCTFMGTVEADIKKRISYDIIKKWIYRTENTRSMFLHLVLEELLIKHIK